MFRRALSLTAIFLVGFSAPLSADMVYKPIDPSFGGDSFNSSHLLGLANAQNQFNKPKTTTTQSATDRFVSLLQSRLYSSLATNVADAIFGPNAVNAGTISFGDQQVSFTNADGQITLTITDFSTGQVTNISVPTLVTQ